MRWDLARVLVYLLGFLAGLVSFAGYADFNPATGELHIYPFNVYTLAASLGAMGSGALGVFALLRGWGGRKLLRRGRGG